MKALNRRKHTSLHKPLVFEAYDNDKKVFVLDTNILMLHPGALTAFHENIVIVPMIVIEEIDHIKNSSSAESDKSYSARRVFREFAEMRKLGSLESGICMENGGVLYVVRNGYDWDDLPEGLEKSNDNIILLTALSLQKHNPGREVILVSNDIGLYTKADACGIRAEEYKHGQAIRSMADMYSGTSELVLKDMADYEQLHSGSNRSVFIYSSASFYSENDVMQPLIMNQCCFIFDPLGERHELALYKGGDENDNHQFVKVSFKVGFGRNEICAKNDEQEFALALLTDTSIDVVSIGGVAGTGKTLLALVGGFMQEKRYEQIKVFRAAVEADETLGYTPGTQEEKFSPWTLPITDVMQVILGGDFSGSDDEYHPKGVVSPVRSCLDRGLVTIEPHNHVRGRTFPNRFIIIDEAQNLTLGMIKLLITRLGAKAKIVFLYDQSQIDRRNLNALSNGPAHLVAKYPGEENFGHITLLKSERSFVAEQAARLL